MDFLRYTTFDDLASLKDSWNHLLQNSASDVPFLTFEYQQTWWKTKGGGEWPENSQLAIIAAFENEQLIGIAPLFFAPNLEGKPALMFIGAVEVSDFLDFIVKPHDLPRFLSALFDFLLNEESLPKWEVLDLNNILETSPALVLLKAEAKRRGWDHKQEHLQPAPYVPLTGDYEAYLAGLNKKQRHEIRRKLRNVEGSLAEIGFYHVEDQKQLAAETEAFIDMMAQDPNKREFLSDAMQQHLRNTVQTAFDAGWLQLSFFTLDGHKAAAHLSFYYDRRLWLYNSGWEWEYREYSPGWVHLAHLIQWCVENDATELDFMRGDEDYKYKFGGIDRHIYRVLLARE